ncbi:hypothetical protein L1987_53572 [Smallanthus sonchifolius]|uniref:Uncharacterized protein n=1 Tax=Smallanthus sonchifolius TaxID=185202 RepID=A0ACB9EXI0_9ASTR|nr:hypothetical protein L1987_53572 [Smallanthus sonchifolius]
MIVPSQAKFEDGSRLNDTVGILVGKDWILPISLDLKWRDKAYKVWFIEEDEEWSPGWCGDTSLQKEESSESGDDDQRSNFFPDSPSLHDEPNGNVMGSPAADKIDESPPAEEDQPIRGINEHLRDFGEDNGSINEEFIPDTRDQVEDGKSPRKGQPDSSEIEATIRMGKELGINSEKLDEMVRRVIDGEMEMEEYANRQRPLPLSQNKWTSLKPKSDNNPSNACAERHGCVLPSVGIGALPLEKPKEELIYLQARSFMSI